MKKALVPIAAIAVALTFAFAMFVMGNNTSTRDGAADAAEENTASPAAVDPALDGEIGEATPTTAEAAEVAQAEPQTQPDTLAVADVPTEVADVEQAAAAVEETTQSEAQDAPPPALRLADPVNAASVTLGSLEPDSEFELEATFNPYGAALFDLKMSGFRFEVDGEEPYQLVGKIETSYAGRTFAEYPYAARWVTIDGVRVDLRNEAWSLAETTRVAAGGPLRRAVYRVTVVDDSGEAIAEVVRAWSVEPGSYDIALDQRVVNLSGRALSVSFSQFLQGDVVDDGAAYLGDMRLFATGYFRPSDPNRTMVHTGSSGMFGSSGAGFRGRVEVIDHAMRSAERGEVGGVWPNPSLSAGSQLVWLASENRYFTLITYPAVEDPAAGLRSIKPIEETFAAIRTHPMPGVTIASSDVETERVVVFSGTTATTTLDAGASLDLGLAIFAGPRDGNVFDGKPVYRLLHFDNLVRYELGCTFCTFQWIAHGLLWYLEFIHGDVLLRWTGLPIGVWDWGIAIIILVVTVRLLLHPITKRAQFNMMKMSKGMQAMQPELEKLKKKYKDDQATLQKEMTALYREKGINPLGFLGCLPMFLQMPIWVALYAMLYFAVELRHEPAFYGVFQAISAGAWPFLESLSEPDRFIPITEESAGFTFPLIPIFFDYSSINILPILMGVVFFVNMKFTTPPPPENESDEQRQMRRQQQIVMKVMPFVMPIFLYAAPSGLTLYICASTAAGILDSYLVRKHIREQEERGELFKKKERKPGGLMDKIGKFMEEKQAQFAELQAQQEALKQKQQRGGKGGGGKNRKKR
ncbi:MAG: YidC/Oxa1 family insertase periplasmic-domain containing protein [Planctomycetota bacterium]